MAETNESGVVLARMDLSLYKSYAVGARRWCEG